MQNDAGSTDTTETEREQGRWTETGREWRKWVTRDRNAEDHTGGQNDGGGQTGQKQMESNRGRQMGTEIDGK